MKLDVTKENIQKWSEIGSRGAFGAAMMLLGEARDDVMVLTADLADATRVTQFKDRWPERFINVGIAEQNLITAGAGLAMTGYTVFCTSFAAFITMRSCEQVRTDVGYQRANVKLLGADGGLVMGTLGNTHYALEDIAVLRAMPNLTILSPADGLEIIKATTAAAETDYPVYIRLTGERNNPVVYHEDYDFEIGKAVWLRSFSGGRAFGAGHFNGRMRYAHDQAHRFRRRHGSPGSGADYHA